MGREDRIAEGRRMGAERAAAREREREAEAAVRARRYAEMDDKAARKEADSISSNTDIEAMGPNKTPDQWEQARRTIRETVIAVARRGETIAYPYIQLAAYESVGLKLGHRMVGRMCAEVNQPTGDECLLSAIIVSSETGRPGEGFEEFAAEQGFPETLPVLQRQVFEKFEP